MNLDDVIDRLRAACDKAGGQAAWASSAGISPAYVSDVLNRRREPGDGILRAMGLEMVKSYRRVSRDV